MEVSAKSRWKAFLKRYFIDGLNGMALGLFSSLIVGLIIKQIGGGIGGDAGAFLINAGTIASVTTGAAIGVGSAYTMGLAQTDRVRVRHNRTFRGQRGGAHGRQAPDRDQCGAAHGRRRSAGSLHRGGCRHRSRPAGGGEDQDRHTAYAHRHHSVRMHHRRFGGATPFPRA